ncbi:MULTISPECIES: hypothetical protein [Streptomyces]|uniref:hypothetical protein n=1 Tax=Streptomyces TaxID=1883 RepID=UPI000A3CC42D|nr:hypothetical protein [Streptomyces viridochromogenes]
MRIIACAALVGAALLTAALPASADDGPVDFGLFQGVNDTKGSTSTDGGRTWPPPSGGTGDGVPRSALGMLVEGLVQG